jgi:integrase
MNKYILLFEFALNNKIYSYIYMEKSEHTLKNYESTISRLKKILGNDKFYNELKKSSKVIELVDKEYENINTRKTYYSRIIKLIKENPQWKIPKKSLDQFIVAFNKNKNLSDDVVEENKPTDKQKDNWIDWPDVLKVREQLKNEAKDLQSFQDYLIVCCYTHIPPVRADFGNMRVAKRFDMRMNQHNNYIILGTKPKFILNKYKTNKYYGPNIIDIPDDLKKVINTWFSQYNKAKKWFLLQEDGKTPLDNNILTKRVLRIFKQQTGKKIGINMLRHSFVNNMINSFYTLKGRKAISKIMGHSIETQLAYFKQV